LAPSAPPLPTPMLLHRVRFTCCKFTITLIHSAIAFDLHVNFRYYTEGVSNRLCPRATYTITQ